MERYQIKRHKDSGIINDPNDWADEVGNPRYILDLLFKCHKCKCTNCRYSKIITET